MRRKRSVAIWLVVVVLEWIYLSRASDSRKVLIICQRPI